MAKLGLIKTTIDHRTDWISSISEKLELFQYLFYILSILNIFRGIYEEILEHRVGKINFGTTQKPNDHGPLYSTECDVMNDQAFVELSSLTLNFCFHF